jgi:hypothetical protein
MCLEEGQLKLQPPGIGNIVHIHPRDQWCAGQRNAGIEGRAESGATATDEPEPGVVHGFYDLCGTIIRAVVDHDKLQRAEPLREDAGDGFVHKTLAVKDAHHDGNNGLRRAHALSRPDNPVDTYPATWSFCWFSTMG